MTMSKLSDTPRVLRVLALHGSEETAGAFPSRLEGIRTMLACDHDMQLDITTVEGPFPKGDGYSWWTMKPGERSFTTKEYVGFDTAAVRVLNAWDAQVPFDLCLGHSQGAIMLAALITLGKVPYHPSMGYVLNGVAFPNPYRKKVDVLKVNESLSTVPRVLFIMGTNDNVTPNETGEELRDSFSQAGFDVQMIRHTGGHAVPIQLDETMKKITQWIVNER